MSYALELIGARRQESERQSLERMMRDLFRDASERSALAAKLAGESHRVRATAERFALEAVALEKEACAIFWLLKMVDRADEVLARGRVSMLPGGVEEAVTAIGRGPHTREHREAEHNRIVMAELRRLAIDGEMMASVETLSITTGLPLTRIRQALQRLGAEGAIEQRRYRPGDDGPRYRLLQEEGRG